MIAIQKFKDNDETEQKVIDAFISVTDPIENDFDDFMEQAYSSYKLGDVIFNLQRDYIATVIAQEFYRISFYKIHELADQIGTFETYLSIFRAIWGNDIEIEFDVPSPAVLNITVSNLGVENFNWVAQSLSGMGGYIYDTMIDQESDFIMFQSTVGINVQEGMDRFIKMISVYGIITTCTLVF